MRLFRRQQSGTPSSREVEREQGAALVRQRVTHYHQPRGATEEQSRVSEDRVLAIKDLATGFYAMRGILAQERFTGLSFTLEDLDGGRMVWEILPTHERQMAWEARKQDFSRSIDAALGQQKK